MQACAQLTCEPAACTPNAVGLLFTEFEMPQIQNVNVNHNTYSDMYMYVTMYCDKGAERSARLVVREPLSPPTYTKRNLFTPRPRQRM